MSWCTHCLNVKLETGHYRPGMHSSMRQWWWLCCIRLTFCTWAQNVLFAPAWRLCARLPPRATRPTPCACSRVMCVQRAFQGAVNRVKRPSITAPSPQNVWCAAWGCKHCWHMHVQCKHGDVKQRDYACRPRLPPHFRPCRVQRCRSRGVNRPSDYGTSTPPLPATCSSASSTSQSWHWEAYQGLQATK